MPWPWFRSMHCDDMGWQKCTAIWSMDSGSVACAGQCQRWAQDSSHSFEYEQGTMRRQLACEDA
eukprot:scaffold125728_cov21-Tisochrysis_lutea.AAC.1